MKKDFNGELITVRGSRSFAFKVLKGFKPTGILM